MHQRVIRQVIILGLVAILGIVGMQTYWVATTWTLNDSEFSQKVQLALYEVARQLADANESDLPSRDIVRQRTSNYFIVNIESEINAARLEATMQQELVRLGLDIPFEYAIFDCTTDQMAYGGYCQATTGESTVVNPPTVGYLPPDDNLLYYFGVKFPTRTGYIWQKMQLVVILSVILLVTVAFFAYSLIIILRQRRLATLQKDFIDNMTHEFKTPLSTIRIAASVFMRDDHVQKDHRLTRYARLIHEQYERLNKQVEKMLQISSIERGNFEIKKERVHLTTLLPPLVSSTQARIDDADGKLTVDFPSEPIPVLADPLHLSNIIYNLLDNAIKYSGPNPDIKVSGKKDRSSFAISVSDKGPGIAAEHQEKLFEKFYRIPTGDVHDVKGFGLGLFYVAHICRSHGWPLKVESQLKRGTTFTIRIPLLPVTKIATPAQYE